MFPILISRFSESYCLVMCSSGVVLCSTSLVWWKYRCSCVKSSKVHKYHKFISISKMNFILSQKVKTAKVRTMWIGRTSYPTGPSWTSKIAKKPPISKRGPVPMKNRNFRKPLILPCSSPQKPPSDKVWANFLKNEILLS